MMKSINLFCQPSPGQFRESEDEPMLLDIKPASVLTGAGGVRMNVASLQIPEGSLSNVGDTLRFFSSGQANGSDPNTIFYLNLDGAMVDDDATEVFTFTNESGGTDFIWQLEMELTLVGNNLIKVSTRLELVEMGQRTNTQPRYFEGYVSADKAGQIDFDLDVDDFSDMAVNLSKLYLFKATNQPSNIGMPENTSFDVLTSSINWEWNGRNDPVSWELQAQRGDTLEWVDTGANGYGTDRGIGVDGAFLAEGDVPALGDAWNGMLRVIGRSGDAGAGDDITFASQAVLFNE